MKKFYTLAIATLAAVSVSAGAPQLKEFNVSAKQASLRAATAINGEAVVAADKSDLTIRKAAKQNAPAIADLAGDYEITIGDWYNGNDSKGEFTAEAMIKIDEDYPDEVGIVCSDLWASIWGRYDATAGTITFDKVYLGPVTLDDGTTVDAYCQPFYYDWDEGSVVYASYSATVSDSKLITFPADHGVAFLAYTAGTDTRLGSFQTVDIVNLSPAGAWKQLGNGTFTENIIYPLFKTENTTPCEVAVRYNEASKVYEVADVFKTLYAELGWDEESPTLVIDAAEPDNCVISLTDTGIYGGETAGEYYIMSMSYNQTNPANCPVDNRVTVNEDDENININFPYHSMLLYTSTSKKLYYASSYASTIVIPKSAGVEGVVADNSNAPVEYFNLQGMRVDAPAAGQLVIRRQGNEVSKMVVR